MANTLKINLAKITDRPIPNGLYHATVVKAMAGITQGSDPKLDVRLKILEGPEADRVIYDTLTLSDDPTSFSMKKLKQLLMSCGYEDKEGDQDIDPEVLIGEVVTIKGRMGKQGTAIDPSTGAPYAPRWGVTEYSPYGNAPQAQDLLNDVDDDD